MIVFDENIHQQRIMMAVAAWYRGRVTSMTTLRPQTIIKDEAIPTVLRRVRHTTFVTTNVTDFWRRVPAHSRYSIVCIALPNEQLQDMPALLRQLFAMPEFKTKAIRMGKVVRVGREQFQYYDVQTAHIIHVRGW